LRVLRVAGPCQLSLGLSDLPVAGCRWQALPEESRGQVLALLVRMIAKGAVVDPDSYVALEAGDA
jgi:hypothetical protein